MQGKYRICCFPGCFNKTSLKGRYKNKKYFKKLCSKHLENKQGNRQKRQLQRKARRYGVSYDEFLDIDISSCLLCGWNKAACDIHRKIPGKDGGKYERDNIIILCPNCHRLVHRGIIKV